MFEDCNANCFDIHDFSVNTPSKTAWFSNSLDNAKEKTNEEGKKTTITETTKDSFPLVGQMGVIKGYAGGMDSDTNITSNLGLESGEGFGIKIKSKTNMSLENVHYPEEKTSDGTETYGENFGGMYLDSYKIETTARHELTL
jgi:hypothetical protein